MEKIKNNNWGKIRESLDHQGYALLKEVLSRKECDEITGFYKEEKLFRSTINMQRYRFGTGEYKYFNYPLPNTILSMRENFYQPLVSIANDWMGRLGIDQVYPEDHGKFLSMCHSRKQARPTPLILRYEVGGFNTLHQDLYGEVYFPFQVVVMLTQEGEDYHGGELVFVEQIPRAQSRAEVVRPGLGDAVIFTTNFRPVKGSRGYYRAKVKHGLSPLQSGIRYALGIIFHDAS